MPFWIGATLLAVALVALVAGLTNHGGQLYSSVTGKAAPAPKNTSLSLGNLGGGLIGLVEGTGVAGLLSSGPGGNVQVA